MAYAWRDLRQLSPRLKAPSCMHIGSIALAASFARKPSYWIDLYHNPKDPIGPDTWFVTKQWSFVRDSKIVEGFKVYDFKTLKHAISLLQTAIQDKVDKNWKISERLQSAEYNSLLEIEQNAFNTILQMTEGVTKYTELKISNPKNKAERLKELQKVRKSKAIW